MDNDEMIEEIVKSLEAMNARLEALTLRMDKSAHTLSVTPVKLADGANALVMSDGTVIKSAALGGDRAGLEVGLPVPLTRWCGAWRPNMPYRRGDVFALADGNLGVATVGGHRKDSRDFAPMANIAQLFDLGVAP